MKLTVPNDEKQFAADLIFKSYWMVTKYIIFWMGDRGIDI